MSGLMLVQKDTVFSGENWSVAEHFSENAADTPYIDRFGVTLWVQHDLRGSIPSGGNILCKEPSVVVIRVSYSRQTKVTYLQHIPNYIIYNIYPITDHVTAKHFINSILKNQFIFCKLCCQTNYLYCRRLQCDIVIHCHQYLITNMSWHQ